MTEQRHDPEWTFLSNHSHVLYCIASWPEIRIRDIAVMVRITERAVQRIVADLERGGYLKRHRVGRRNHYRLKPGLHLRHPLERHVEVGRLLTILRPGKTAPRNRKNLAAVAARRRNALSARSSERSVSLSEKHRGKSPQSARQKI